MNKGSSENKILLVGLVIIVLIVGFLFIRNSRKTSLEQMPVDQQDSSNQAEQQIVPEQEITVEEGLYLEVVSPVDKSRVYNSSLTISGKTEPNAEVFINEAELNADSSGNFSAVITLEEGENIVVVTASDNEGNYSEKSLIVTYEPVE